MHVSGKGHRRAVNPAEVLFDFLNTGDIPCFDAVVLCGFFFGAGCLLLLATFVIGLFSQYQLDHGSGAVPTMRTPYSAEYVQSKFGVPEEQSGVTAGGMQLQSPPGQANAAALF